jgi:hypothetical protein
MNFRGGKPYATYRAILKHFKRRLYLVVSCITFWQGSVANRPFQSREATTFLIKLQAAKCLDSQSQFLASLLERDTLGIAYLRQLLDLLEPGGQTETLTAAASDLISFEVVTWTVCGKCEDSHVYFSAFLEKCLLANTKD